MKRQGIAILGATGSIGRSSLEVIRHNPDRYQVVALSGNQQVKTLAEQANEFAPLLLAVGLGKGNELKSLLKKGYDPEILEGQPGLLAVARCGEANQVIAALVGACGIEPVLAALKAKKRVNLANKEAIVMAGPLVMQTAKENGAEILPVDSEHNAIFQALQGSKRQDLDHVILTASGGPFRNRAKAEFNQITKEEALKHPNWDMGAKITIDSATMMNKALEVIEAKWLFDLHPSQIKVVVHPQSILHSAVAYQDGSLVAQLGTPNMQVPIAYCLAWPHRITSGVKPLDLASQGKLEFFAPDFEKFESLGFAFDALHLGGGAPAALNAANEELVAQFLQGGIGFHEIFTYLRQLMDELKQLRQGRADFPFAMNQFSDALQADQWGRRFVQQALQGAA